eukprot:jgi/Chrzof1/7832/Cz02g38060.t1
MSVDFMVVRAAGDCLLSLKFLLSSSVTQLVFASGILADELQPSLCQYMSASCSSLSSLPACQDLQACRHRTFDPSC